MSNYWCKLLDEHEAILRAMSIDASDDAKVISEVRHLSEDEGVPGYEIREGRRLVDWSLHVHHATPVG